MAPTTLPGQRATTCPFGRDVNLAGYPIRMAELLATLRTPGFIARQTVHTPLAIIQTKKVIKKAFEYQAEGRCYSMVEVLSTCCTNWGLSPHDACGWLEEHMLPYYPVRIFKSPEGDAKESNHAK